MPEFAEWESFYVIVGAAAGALIGLQFVVMTLVAERPSIAGSGAQSAFATPTIVHFSASLLISASQRAPWQSFGIVAALWAVVGVSGVVYGVVIARRMRRQHAYAPELEDWLFHGLLPLVAYALLVVAAITARSHTHDALFGVGTAALLLLFIGIHNAWDSVAYLVTRKIAAQE